ncbi:MAG: cytochrome c biogenesis protein ResB [Intrasporangium sp.]|uniref:cytochrome c biogenesis protein ResB n=1 Tax=Intrasporangium sp. TaxID=1925024 RepID=UPI0026489D28|nr:cytochrome c biogenesis protein ResB [Intrasporangium sp.]MDN5796441.1 cytochrome c biogenesis protein ResB [Intrasporangium sp.]
MTSTDTRTPRRTTPEPQPPDLGVLGMLRWAWRQLTSMRTALFLLLLISVAAVPGSIFPQRNIDPGRVADYLTRHQSSGPWLDRLGFFDVFSSPWFSAIYLLLFISLIGCIVPRAKVHLKALRSRPPRAPARPERLEHHASLTTSAAPEQVLATAREVLASRRFRVHSHDAASVSAESGYLRETGNLVFHVALTGIIVGMAVGHLFGWRGDVIVPEGQKFASSISTYNTFSPGPWVNPARIPSFVLTVDKMQADFIQTPGKTFGQPRDFIAHTTVQARPGAAAVPEQISVNHPLSIDGADVFLLGNGYTPVITVRDAQGEVLYHDATPFLPQDQTYRSVGVVKVSALPAPKQLGLTGFFLPTAEPTFANGPASVFPDALDPELALSVWEGTLFPGGMPQSVYTLNTEAMKQVTKPDGSPVLVRLKPGQTYELPGDRGSVTFDSVKRFAGLSVRHDPGELIALVSAILTTAGLILALTLKRRRVFVRVRQADDPDGRAATVVSIGGLSKDSDAGLTAVIQAVHDRLAERTTAT